MAYKLYVNGNLFQTIANAAVINKGIIVLGGTEFEFDNSSTEKDLSAIILQYIDQLIADTPSSQPAWNSENYKGKWNYIDGVFMNAVYNLYKVTDKNTYKDFFIKYINYYINESGTFVNLKSSSTAGYTTTELDSVCESKILFDAFAETNDSRYSTGINYTYKNLINEDNIPICKNNINFSHKASYENQIWMDGTYMYMPFWCRYAIMYNNPTVTVGNLKETMFEILHDQIDYIVNGSSDNVGLKDSTTGLYYHGQDTDYSQSWANSKTGNSPEIWTRANGWFAMALVDCLDYYWPTDNALREDLITWLNDLLESSCSYLTSNGVFRQLIVRDATYSGYTNYEEESGTAQFAYAMIKAARNGLVDKTYLTKGITLFKSCFNVFVSDADTNGEVTDSTTKITVGPLCSSGGLGNVTSSNAAAYYISNYDKFIAGQTQSSTYAEVAFDDAKGTGPLITAYLQYRQRNKVVHKVKFTYTDTTYSTCAFWPHYVYVDDDEYVSCPCIRNWPTGYHPIFTTDDGTIIDIYTTKITQDLNLNLSSWDLAPECTIHYSANLDGVSDPATRTVSWNTVLTEEMLADQSMDYDNTEYEFQGWIYTEDTSKVKGIGEEAKVGDRIKTDIYLQAQWLKIEMTSVHYFANLDTVENPADKSIQIGKTLTSEYLTDQGMISPSVSTIFKQWNYTNSTSSVTSSKANIGDLISAETYLQAEWFTFAGDSLSFKSGDNLSSEIISANNCITAHGSSSDKYDSTYDGLKISGNTSTSRYIRVDLPCKCKITVIGNGGGNARYMSIATAPAKATSSDTAYTSFPKKTVTTMTVTVEAGTYYINASGSIIIASIQLEASA